MAILHLATHQTNHPKTRPILRHLGNHDHQRIRRTSPRILPPTRPRRTRNLHDKKNALVTMQRIKNRTMRPRILPRSPRHDPQTNRTQPTMPQLRTKTMPLRRHRHQTQIPRGMREQPMVAKHDGEWQKARAEAKKTLPPICAQCGKYLEGRDWTIDHIIPINKGGTHDLVNLQSMCLVCNGRKQDRTTTRQAWKNKKWF